MNELEKSAVFVAIALLTIGVAYLYQRHERVQALERIWLWPAIYCAIAAYAVWQRWPVDSRLAMWMSIGFVLGLILGAARGLAFEVRSGEKPGTLILRPTLLSGTIFIIALLFNEYEHVFHHGDPNLGRISASLMLLTAGSSIAANAARVIRWKHPKA